LILYIIESKHCFKSVGWGENTIDRAKQKLKNKQANEQKKKEHTSLYKNMKKGMYVKKAKKEKKKSKHGIIHYGIQERLDESKKKKVENTLPGNR
jgi:hypothetical protein